MIVNTSSEKIATISGANGITDFKIKASSKAFNILSSSLYANKIRAIIRELSTNAFDSHVAAGKKDVPFDVHLPNSLEPWFSIRDYGVGLDEDEVKKIYTTYFESTKTESNDFVGALGLGSKSPFSYTDNFSVTAIKNNKKSIYTAFVNDIGVPSIAKMTECETDEQNGVEIKFAVENQRDFPKFDYEAKNIYMYFDQKPVVSGGVHYYHVFREYNAKDIAPGIHSLKSDTFSYYRNNTSIAVMGNVAYPIDVPNSEQNLGSLAQLLKCNLEINFDIGDLDFQASREGLSYIPSTIAKIKEKLIILNRNIYKKLVKELGPITNDWEKAFAIHEKYSFPFYRPALTRYVKKNNVKYSCDVTNLGSVPYISVDINEINEKFNVKLSAFCFNGNRVSMVNPSQQWCLKSKSYTSHAFVFPVEDTVCFVETDTNTGALERSKKHWKNKNAWKNDHPELAKTSLVFVMSPSDKSKKANYTGLLESIGNPPLHILASSIPVVKKQSDKKSINQLEIVMYSKGAWERVGQYDNFTDDENYYYLELSGNNISETSIFSKNHLSSVEIAALFKKTGIKEFNVPIYGVRKHSISEIKKKENWINLEEYAMQVLQKRKKSFAIASAINHLHTFITKKENFANRSVAEKITDKKSDYLSVFNFLKKARKFQDYDLKSVKKLYESIKMEPATIDAHKLAKLESKIAEKVKKYPLVKEVNLCYSDTVENIADYINMIDQFKKEQ